MTVRAKALVEQFLELPETEQYDVLKAIEAQPSPEYLQEVYRRTQAALNGEVRLYTREEALAEVRAVLAEARERPGQNR